MCEVVKGQVPSRGNFRGRSELPVRGQISPPAPTKKHDYTYAIPD